MAFFSKMPLSTVLCGISWVETLEIWKQIGYKPNSERTNKRKKNWNLILRNTSAILLIYTLVNSHRKNQQQQLENSNGELSSNERKKSAGVVCLLVWIMHQKQFIEANLACQRFGQLFIHVCLLRIDFSQRKLTGRMNERHCIANFQFFTLMVQNGMESGQ